MNEKPLDLSTVQKTKEVIVDQSSETRIATEKCSASSTEILSTSINKIPELKCLKNITNLSSKTSTDSPKSIRDYIHWPEDDILGSQKKKNGSIRKRAPPLVSGSKWQNNVEKKQNAKRTKSEEITLKKKIKIEKQE